MERGGFFRFWGSEKCPNWDGFGGNHDRLEKSGDQRWAFMQLPAAGDDNANIKINTFALSRLLVRVFRK